ncbi:hypothetical protein RCJ22_10955 [Vibrio sp. FNV 38]|nr:hypothetical protein [Vibrio sp. FNV 38]
MNSTKQLIHEIEYVAELTQASEQVNDAQSKKLRQSYRGARKWIEATEIELQRSRIMMVDGEGNMRPFSLYSEH